MCYLFVKTKTSFENALKHCADLDAYVFNPVSSSSIDFVSSFINTSGLFENSVWWSGITPILYNESYISSNGILTVVDHLLNDDLPQKHTVFNVDTMTLGADGGTKHPLICQTDKGKCLSICY